MHKKTKKIIALLMTITMILALLPMDVIAQDISEQAPESDMINMVDEVTTAVQSEAGEEESVSDEADRENLAEQSVALAAKDFFDVAQQEDVSAAAAGGSLAQMKSSARAKIAFAELNTVAQLTVDGVSTEYSSFADAVAAWTNASAGAELTLCQDVTTTAAINFKGTKTLDLNGYGIRYAGSGKASVFISSTWNSNSSPASLTINDSNPERIHKITLSGYRGTAVETVNTAGTTSVDASGSGTVYVSGGYITGGTGTNLSGSTYIGGAIYMRGDTKTATINGGTFVGNACDFGGLAHLSESCISITGGSFIYNKGNGAAFNMDGAARLYLTGGEIAHNTSGIRFATGNSSVLFLGGNDKSTSFADNGDYDITLSSGRVITIGMAITSSELIHVKTSSTGEFTKYWSRMGTADPADYFKCDPAYFVVKNSSGEAELINRPAAGIQKGDAVTYYNDFSSAVSNWTANSTLKLLDDVTTGSTITVPAGEHTLDLNGHTIKAASSDYSVMTVGSGADLTIIDTAENAGKITGGSVGQNYGGGVTVDGGKLTLKGGAISGNANTYSGIGNCGGGVHVKNSGQFYMEGGEISGNTSYVGGGVCSDSSATTVSITGGAIKNNTTERFGSAIWAGRTDNATFRIGGNAEIVGNISKWTSDKDGEATINFGSQLLVSGDPTIQGDWKASGTRSPNTHINFDNSGSAIQCIELDGELTNNTGTAKITISPIYRWNDLQNGQSFVFTKNWNQYMGAADPADYFRVDDSVSGVKIIRKNGEAVVTGSSELGDLYITFDSNEGEGTMNPQLVAGTNATLTQNQYEREGCIFAGWNTKKDGSGTGYTDKASVTLTGDITLYAQWKEAAACVISGETTTNYGSISEAVNAWKDGSTLKLFKDVTIGSTITVPSGEHTLDLNGHGIKMTGSGSIFNIGSDATLNLNDSNTEATHKFTFGSNSLATVDDLLTSGYKTFNGGYITGGKGSNVSGVSSAGAVLVYGNFNMNGGTILGNCARRGGGVYIESGAEMNLDGGVIIQNQGLEISGSTITNGDGGGIFNKGSLNIKSGEISANCAVWGGGVENRGTFNMTGGKITANSTVNDSNDDKALGGGVYVYNNTVFKLSGDAVISENVNDSDNASNVYLRNGAIVTVPDSFSDDARIGITLQIGSGVLTSGLSEKGTAANFTSDNADYTVDLNDSGEAYLRYPDVANASAEGYEGDYDGEAHGITVTAPEGASIKYGTEEGSYTLDASPAYTNAGSYTVYYQVSQAKRTSVSGSAVVKINKIDATVTITGHFATANYDGEEHGAEGYDISFSTPLYTAEDFSFSGKAEAVRTNAGTTLMGLAAEQFQNTNNNFETVTFAVTDGFVTVNPIDVTVTITGHTLQADYDGTAHSVDGYDVSFSTPLYTAENFTFSGRAEAVRTNKGVTQMGLAPEQFENANANFATVTFVVSDGYITIDPIDVIVTISGHNETADYDGKAHSVSGYDVSFSNALYTEDDFTFSGNATAERIDAGTAKMGLASNQFENTNENFATVAFVVNDGTLIIHPIDVTVTITGHNSTVDYDGKAHSVDGYEVAFGNALYTEADFSFSGRAEAVRTNVGTTEMGLAPEQFENLNANFKEVTFEVTDGFQTVNPVDAVITSAPHAKDTLDYNGKAQALFVAGVAEGGTLYYALGKDMDTVPANKAFSTSVPTAKEIGNYYIWYKVKGDKNHNSLSPEVFKVTLADPDWVTISGTIFKSNKTPLSGAEVILMSGNQEVDTIVSYENGEYFFTVPAGVYSIVVKYNGVTVTNIADVSGDVTSNIVMPAANTDSVLKVVDSDKSIAVGGLEAEANAIRERENIPANVNVTVSMTVKAIAENETAGAKAITNFAKDKYVEFYDLRVERTVGKVTTNMDTTTNVLEIVIPCSFTTKRELEVFTCDGSNITTLILSDSKEPGTYRVDEKNGLIYIYANTFATVALAYQPYFSVHSNMTLGSFAGEVSVKLVKDSTGQVFELNHVSLQNISFTGVPKGTYTMTLTWTDGAENTLAMPFTIG